MSKRRTTRSSELRIDFMLAALTLAFSLVSGLSVVLGGNTMPLYAWPLLVVGPLSLLAWRTRPRTVLLVSSLALVGMSHLEFGPVPAVAALVAIGLSMYKGYRGLTVAVVLVFSAFTAIGNFQAVGWHFTTEAIQQTMLVVGWLHVAMISGEGRRQRDAYIEEAERTREQELRRKASDERVRIARELHDSLTHSISVIRVQAGVAVHLARKRGEQPAEALVAVEEAAGDATRELRETLTMLRGEEGPRLGRVKDLVERYRGLGFEIEVECPDCASLEVGSEIDHAAYRIIQEALTNAVRHSRGDRIEVRLARRGDSLEIEVADNGDVGEFAPGSGITGMRERVDAFGGTLVVGPRAPGFAVRAELPADPETAPVEGLAP